MDDLLGGEASTRHRDAHDEGAERRRSDRVGEPRPNGKRASGDRRNFVRERALALDHRAQQAARNVRRSPMQQGEPPPPIATGRTSDRPENSPARSRARTTRRRRHGKPAAKRQRAERRPGSPRSWMMRASIGNAVISIDAHEHGSPRCGSRPGRSRRRRRARRRHAARRTAPRCRRATTLKHCYRRLPDQPDVELSRSGTWHTATAVPRDRVQDRHRLTSGKNQRAARRAA